MMQKTQAFIRCLFMLALAITSILVVKFAVLAFLFTAATSASDPDEWYEPLVMFVFALAVFASVTTGWVLFWRARRK